MKTFQCLKPILVCLSIVCLTGCDLVDQLRTDTFLTKRNSDGDRCSYEKDFSQSVMLTKFIRVWNCPISQSEQKSLDEYRESQKQIKLNKTVENWRLESLLSSQEYLNNRHKEPLKTLVINAKADGRITHAELNQICKTVNDMQSKIKHDTDTARIEAELKANKILTEKL